MLPVLTLLACAQPTPATGPTYWADVKPILDGRCNNCHGDQPIGGFSLQTYASAVDWSPLIIQQTQAGLMPPWPASDAAEYAFDWTLTDEQLSTLVDWVDSGTPEGDPADESDPLDPAGSSLSRADISLEMPTPYRPNTDWDDDYRCFPIPWTGDEAAYITGFNAIPGNTAVVHHVAAFLIGADNLLGDAVFEQLQDWDDAEPDPGYTCFGGPSGPTGDLELPIQQIAQWVPGSQGLDFPDGTGIQVEPGAWVVLQVHYHPDPSLDDPTDQTAIEMKLDPSVTHTAAFAPWLSGAWPLGNMQIPAGQSASFTAEGDPRAFFELLNPTLALDDGFTIHGGMLHMHGLGASAEVHLDRADGTTATIVDIPQWDFDWQLGYTLAEPLVFEDGDALSLTCVFDNEGTQDANWGEGSDEEMCVANLYISHR